MQRLDRISELLLVSDIRHPLLALDSTPSGDYTECMQL